MFGKDVFSFGNRELSAGVLNLYPPPPPPPPLLPPPPPLLQPPPRQPPDVDETQPGETVTRLRKIDKVGFN